ncbi:ATP-binding protein [Bacillus sp. FJAT-45350]|uniref:ATP-binding protein n=1 Tax=Bacillus sp. FJAT-45350 TaxID=2011014 RepID=UPI000BB8DECA|nr:sensor histidine kinase [Bacillus sp. FJAT-45350]
MYGFEQLLLNVLFLIVFLLFIPLILELNGNSFIKRNKRFIVCISALLAIITCMSFPIPIMDGYFFDLRFVAITFGGLYGGISLILFLTGGALVYRFFLGGSGAYATVIVITILSTLLILLTNKFQNSSRKKKIVIGSSLSVFASLVAILNSTFIFNAAFSSLFIFWYLSITLCTTVLVIYLHEVFRDSVLINKRVIKAEKMEVVSHLASSVSHEVRNPLTTVRGFLQMMEQFDLPEDKSKEYMKISIDEIDRANDIIRDYLTFAKPSPENIQTLSIRKELHRTIQLITPLANMNGVEITTKIDDLFIKGEEQFFQQCLVNITKNCIEAMPHNGTLSIEAKEENGELLLLIADTGKGMTKEQLERIGEPYFTTKGREGTGLGMMVSMNIIETMNGKLNVTSKLKEGTNFYIRLPIVEKAA